MKKSQPDTMTAEQIRSHIDRVRQGDLRGVPEALASTGTRTEAARADLRAALSFREIPLHLHPYHTNSPMYRAKERYKAIEATALHGAYWSPKKGSLRVSPTTRTIYNMPVADPSSTLAGIRAAGRARWEKIRVARVLPLLRHAYKVCDYRVAKGSWAGGQHDLIVRIGTPGASSETNRAWSSNGKWSGLDSEHVGPGRVRAQCSDCLRPLDPRSRSDRIVSGRLRGAVDRARSWNVTLGSPRFPDSS